MARKGLTVLPSALADAYRQLKQTAKNKADGKG
jgi:hypothetical protein